MRENLIQRLERGIHLPKGIKILHTAPHHDDILLAYHPLLKKLIESNESTFAFVTSGFNSVTDNYIIKTLKNSVFHLEDLSLLVFSKSYQFLIKSFLDAAKKNNEKEMSKWESALLLRNIKVVFNLMNFEELKQKTIWLLYKYFPNKKTGDADETEIQILKGAMRESESDRKLFSLGVDFSMVFHLRAPFYSREDLTEEEIICPIIELLNQVRPHLLTVAFDPENVGPKTHEKVLKAIQKAVKKWNQPIKVWGYRNVWSRFKLSETTLISPVTEDELEEMNRIFLSCYSTQKVAAFPSSDFEGPFSKLAEKIQREQYQEVKELLGEKYIAEHPILRNAAAVICLKELNLL